MCRRFRVQPATQYELGNTKDWPRRRHWRFPWAGLADPFHPRSLEDWQEHQRRLDEELDADNGDGEQPVT